MKKQLVAAALMALTLTGCGDDVLDWRNASVSGGKVYANNENKPFSGSLTNVPENSLPFNNAFNDLLVQHNRAMERIKDRQQGFFGRNLVCDTTVEEGLVTGTTSCRNSSGNVRWKASLAGKSLDGVAEIFDITGKTVITRNEYAKGVADGKLEVFSPNTGKLIGEYHSKNGKADGEQTAWDEKTGNKISHADTKDGMYVGVQESWSPEGKLTGVVPYSNGAVDGEVKVWDAETGKQTALATYVNGQKIGRATSWDAQGNVLSDGNMNAKGILVPIASAQPAVADLEEDEWATAVKPANKQCVDEWVTYAHKVDGEDAMIGIESMKDWDSMCSDGQHPPA